MARIAVYFGSTTGTCEELAGKIGSALAGAEIRNVTELDNSAEAYDMLVLGTSTWGNGDLQDDWYSGVETLKKLNLHGKKVAVFGCGDSSSYSDTFCSAMKAIYDAAKEAGATIVGDEVDAAGYSFDASDAVVDGKFVGLAIDEVNEADKTDERIAAWIDAIK